MSPIGRDENWLPLIGDYGMLADCVICMGAAIFVLLQVQTKRQQELLLIVLPITVVQARALVVPKGGKTLVKSTCAV